MSSFEKANFQEQWVNKDEMYTVGYDSISGQKIIAITISWMGWYDIYFRLTDDEFEWHKSDPDALNDLASRMAVDKGKKFYSDRLLLNEGPVS